MRKQVTAVLVVLPMLLVALPASAGAHSNNGYPSCRGGPLSLWKSGNELWARWKVECNGAVHKMNLSSIIQKKRWWGWQRMAGNLSVYYNSSGTWKRGTVTARLPCRSGGTHTFRAQGWTTIFTHWHGRGGPWYMQGPTYARTGVARTYRC